jgi:hypothetical protein
VFKVLGGKPARVKAQEGIGWLSGLNPQMIATDLHPDQSPVGGLQDLVSSGQLGDRETKLTT